MGEGEWWNELRVFHPSPHRERVPTGRRGSIIWNYSISILNKNALKPMPCHKLKKLNPHLFSRGYIPFSSGNYPRWYEFSYSWTRWDVTCWNMRRWDWAVWIMQFLQFIIERRKMHVTPKLVPGLCRGVWPLHLATFEIGSCTGVTAGKRRDRCI